jgi:hypothetical protein
MWVKMNVAAEHLAAAIRSHRSCVWGLPDLAVRMGMIAIEMGLRGVILLHADTDRVGVPGALRSGLHVDRIDGEEV